MKIALTKLSTKDFATLAQRIISNAQSGKYPAITNHPLIATLQNSYTRYDQVYAKQVYSGKGKDVSTADDERDMAYSSLKADTGNCHLQRTARQLKICMRFLKSSGWMLTG